MKIVILSPFIDKIYIKGGVENHIYHLVNEYTKLPDVQVHIITCSDKKYKPNNLPSNISIHYVRGKKMPWTIRSISFDIIEIIKYINEIKPDIIHAQMIGAPNAFVAAILCTKYPSLVTVHTMTYQGVKFNQSLSSMIHDFIWIILEKWECRRLNNFILVADNLLPEMIKYHARNCTIISPNGIEEKWFNKQPIFTPIKNILCVGRIHPIKGQDTLIKAVKILSDEGHDLNLTLIGDINDNEYYLSLKKTILIYNLGNRITIKTNIDDISLINEYHKCDLFILPSYQESSPQVIIEAMAAARPIIATNVGNIPKMVIDSYDGLLYNYGEIDALVVRIKKILSNQELCRVLGMNGQKKVANITWSKVAKETYNLYEKILDNYKGKYI